MCSKRWCPSKRYNFWTSRGHSGLLILNESTSNEEIQSEDQNQLLKIVKDITSKGFVRNNYKKNLVDLSDVKINLKGKK